MLKLELKGVHVFEKVPGSSGAFRLVRTNPAMRIGGTEGHLYIQGGHVFEEGGKEVPISQVPAWFTAALEFVNPAALKECGWNFQRPAAAKK